MSKKVMLHRQLSHAKQTVEVTEKPRSYIVHIHRKHSLAPRRTLSGVEYLKFKEAANRTLSDSEGLLSFNEAQQVTAWQLVGCPEGKL